METPITLNLAEAAAYLHVHEQTLLKLARSGAVPAAITEPELAYLIQVDDMAVV